MNAMTILWLVSSLGASQGAPQEAPVVEPSTPLEFSKVSPEENPVGHVALGLGGTTLLVGGAVAALSPVFFHVEPEQEPMVRWAGVAAAGVGATMIAVSSLLFLDDPEVVWTRGDGPVPAF